MSALPPIPEGVAAAAPHGLLIRGVSLPGLREVCRIFQNLDPFRTPGERGRGGDDGVDLFGIIECAP
jgi:hypothetical protein